MLFVTLGLVILVESVLLVYASSALFVRVHGVTGYHWSAVA